MSLFVIADLHLSSGTDKPMDIFGDNWQNHEEKIAKDWKEKVTEDDLVVIPGDFSWAMDLKETFLSFEYLSKLPGKKLLLKGNHDYWWSTLTKMRNYLEENNFKNIDFIQNNFYEYEDVIITGTHGWIIDDVEDNKRLIAREQTRLKLELEAIKEKYGESKEVIVFMHYPPYIKENNKYINPFSEIFEDYKIKTVYYGHLHGSQAYAGIEDFEVNGTTYKLISADYLDFKLQKIF